MTERKLYSVREFCERNSISRTTLWRLIKAGVLQKVKAGRKALVTAESERAWHESTNEDDSRAHRAG